jgi:AcrR family transcriptional regulator
MPKPLTDSEREHIKKKLIDEARLCLSQYGMKKTTVDELAKRANIPKGTFYLFYESKELLFFDVICAFHDDLQTKLISRISTVKENINPAKLTELILELYKMVEESFMLRFLTDGEMELLIRKLPPEIAEAHAEKDDFSLEQLLYLVPNMKKSNIKGFSAALRGIFLSMLHKHEIGEEVFDDALKIMIHGVVIQMFEGETR